MCLEIQLGSAETHNVPDHAHRLGHLIVRLSGWQRYGFLDFGIVITALVRGIGGNKKCFCVYGEPKCVGLLREQPHGRIEIDIGNTKPYLSVLQLRIECGGDSELPRQLLIGRVRRPAIVKIARTGVCFDHRESACQIVAGQSRGGVRLRQFLQAFLRNCIAWVHFERRLQQGASQRGIAAEQLPFGLFGALLRKRRTRQLRTKLNSAIVRGKRGGLPIRLKGGSPIAQGLGALAFVKGLSCLICVGRSQHRVPSGGSCAGRLRLEGERKKWNECRQNADPDSANPPSASSDWEDPAGDFRPKHERIL